MPKPQKYRDVIKAVRANGWVLIRRGKGDHEIWGILGSSSPIDKHSIPHHSEVSAGIIGDLIKKLPHTPYTWR